MEQKQEANRKRLQDLSLLIRRTESQESDVQTFIHEIRQYAAIQELDEAMLNGLNMKKGIILLQITPQVTPHDLMEIIA